MSLTRFLGAIESLLRWKARLIAGAAVRVEWMKTRSAIRRIPELAALVKTFRASPDAGWSIAANDVLRLYKLVLAKKPVRILELGTGIGFSTAVMALALEKIGHGEIISLEQDQKCVGIARSLIPANLARFVRVVHTSPEIFRIERLSPWLSFAGYRWAPQPNEKFYFVLVDGPGGWKENGRVVSLDSGDIFRLIPAIAPGGWVYVDGRRATVKKIRRYLGHYLSLRERDTEFSLFERTPRPAASPEDIEFIEPKIGYAEE